MSVIGETNLPGVEQILDYNITIIQVNTTNDQF